MPVGPFFAAVSAIPTSVANRKRRCDNKDAGCATGQLEEQVKQAEQSIRTRLENGAALEPGDHRAELKENFRRNVAWKAVVIRLARRLRMNGETYCAKVLNSTKSTRTVSVFVVIE